MAEFGRNFEKARRAIHGFYVFGVKKDQRTGHYVGVATWVAKGVPLAGTQVRPMGAKKVVKASTDPGQQSLQAYAAAFQHGIVQWPAPKAVDPIAKPVEPIAKQSEPIVQVEPTPKVEPLPRPPSVQKTNVRQFTYADHSDSYEF